MNSLTQTQSQINIQSNDLQALVSECLKAAANTYQEFVAKNWWSGTWEEMATVYLQVWGEEQGVDLSGVIIPSASVDQFNAALLDDPDYADWLAQSATGIPMF